MLTVTVDDGEAGVTLAVDSPQFDATALATWQTIESGAANPASGVNVAVVDVPSPATTLPVLGVIAIVKSTPVPLSVAVRPLYSRLVELTPSVPFWGPVAVGRNVTLTEQLASAAIVVPHAAVLTEYWPVVTKGGIGNGPLARLVSVSVCVAEAPTSRLP